MGVINKFVVVTALLGIAQAQNLCRTPANELGYCINLKRCSELLAILTTTPRTPQSLDFLKRSHCGFENRDPLVCCVDRSSNDGRNQNYPTPGNPYPTAPVYPGNGNGNNFNNGNNNNFNNGNGNNDFNNNGNGNNGFNNNGNGNNGFNNNGNANSNNNNNNNNGGGSYTSNLLPNDCGEDLSNRIIGGNATGLDEFPWMALLEYRKPTGLTTACGGALISKRYVLTAAHCLKGRSLPSTWRLQAVRLGEYNTETERDCIPDGADGEFCTDDPVTVGIEEQIVHEGYEPNSASQRFDIALLRLARDVRFSSFVKPICLPLSANLGQRLQVAGWGKTEESSASEVKLKVVLPLVDRAACLATYQEAGVTLGDGQICVGGEAGKDSCRGDSGGPLMQRERSPEGMTRWAEVGVVSFGPSPCGMRNWPGVYTKVYDFVPWITSKLRP